MFQLVCQTLLQFRIQFQLLCGTSVTITVSRSLTVLIVIKLFTVAAGCTGQSLGLWGGGFHWRRGRCRRRGSCLGGCLGRMLWGLPLLDEGIQPHRKPWWVVQSKASTNSGRKLTWKHWFLRPTWSWSQSRMRSWLKQRNESRRKEVTSKAHLIDSFGSWVFKLPPQKTKKKQPKCIVPVSNKLGVWSQATPPVPPEAWQLPLVWSLRHSFGPPPSSWDALWVAAPSLGPSGRGRSGSGANGPRHHPTNARKRRGPGDWSRQLRNTTKTQWNWN